MDGALAKGLVRSLVLIVVAALASPAVAQPQMTFRIAPQTELNVILRAAVLGGQHEVFAAGEIDEGATARFLEFLSTNSIDDAIVLFDSPGGSLSEGIQLGEAIRERGFDTGVGSYGADGGRKFEGTCASACTYAFVGGDYRFFNGGRERLGIHQFYKDGENQADLGDAQVLSAILMDHLRRMDIDSRAFVLASSARGDSMRWLSIDEARLLNISNDGKGIATAEIKLLESVPYLKLEQAHSNVIARALVHCYGNRPTFSFGVVTTPEISALRAASLTRAYVETNEGLKIQSDEIEHAGHALWMRIEPNNVELAALLRAEELGFWSENGGPMRMGAYLDLLPVREKLHYFVENCQNA